MAAELFPLEWTRPLGFAALLLVPLVAWLALRQRRPRPELTATVEIWREALPQSAAERSHASREFPWSLFVVLAALTLGALALAGPRSERGDVPVRWSVLVDRSPSMSLPHSVGDDARSPTRLERALSAARERIASPPFSAGEIDWFAWDGSTFAPLERAVLEDELRRVPRAHSSEPDWERFDLAGALWVTDAAPASSPQRAGYVASGGEAVPGPIATSGSTRLDWDGERVLEVERGAASRVVSIEPEVPELVARVVAAWASARGFTAQRTASDDAALSVALVVAAGEPVAVRAGRDGWLASGRARRVEPAAISIWLRAGDLELVRWAPGRVEVAWTEIDDPEGDPAAFAVSWAELLDDAALPAPGVVPSSERLAAGEPRIEAPKAPPETKRGATNPIAIETWLAAAAALLALLAAAVRR